MRNLGLSLQLLMGILFLALGTMVTGCGMDIAPPAQDIFAIGAESNGQTIELEVGGTLELTLNSNPTTGYAWQTITAPDPALLEVKEEYLGPDSTAIGAGGKNRWTMKALNPGKTTLKIVYKPTYGSDVKGETYQITIQIK